jgi:uncharacterized protein (TIGR00297 family)
MPTPTHLITAALAACAVAGAAKAVRALSVSGALAAAAVGFCLFGFGGWPGAMALLLFFVTSSALSRLGRRRKEVLAFEKGGERDAGQVLANGGVAALCAALLPLFPGAAWPAAALLGALAEANADTWATELGSLAGKAPRLITTFRPAPTGASGAISLPGTAAALAGACLIAAVALPFGLDVRGVLAVALGGFVGAMTDSLLGATLQVQYRCPACGKLTERRTHCDDQPTEPARGLPWLGNDLVNALSTLTGAVVAALSASL